MTDYVTEEEQIALIKQFLKQYGWLFLAAIALALGLSYGWRFYLKMRSRYRVHASVIYDSMLYGDVYNKQDAVAKYATMLTKKYARTPYAPLASMMLAKYDVKKTNYKDAVTHLNWAIKHSHDPAITEIAKLRLARVFIAEKKYDQALDLVANPKVKTYQGLANEIRGDAYATAINLKAAKKAYQDALNTMPDADVLRPLVRMKLNNIRTKDDENKIEN